MKKRILIFICIISITLFCIGPFACYASEAGNPSATGSDIFTLDFWMAFGNRLWEYCIQNKTIVLGAIGDAIIVFIYVIAKIRSKKRNKDFNLEWAEVRQNTSGTAASQTSVVNAVNSMIEGYNGMQNTYEKNQGTEESRNKLIGAVMVQNTAILEMLSTVYVNSKNLPQGVKDIITLKYAKCQKALSDDQLLCTIVETVREKVNESSDNTSEE